MKGVILAGGNGVRMQPLTLVTNKHCLPVGRIPMIHHCVNKLVEGGLNEILVVTGGEHFGSIAEYLGSGSRFGCGITYRVQDGATGIAGALSLAEGFVQPGETMCVLLGDNIFSSPLSNIVSEFNPTLFGSMIVLKEVHDPERYGVPTFVVPCSHTSMPIISEIVEKPKKPNSSFAVTGIYFYDYTVFDKIRSLKPSPRGELEITDVNNAYIHDQKMSFTILDGWWTDAGTHESYRYANKMMEDVK